MELLTDTQRKALDWWNSLSDNPVFTIICRGELTTQYFDQFRKPSSLTVQEIESIWLREVSKTSESENITILIPKKDLEEILTFVFTGGENWGVTYSGWFNPSKEETKVKINEVIKKSYELLNIKKNGNTTVSH